VETTAAILLRKTKLSDTSLIVGWFTEAHGKIKTVAKGARRPKSAFAGRLDLFFEAEIQFIRSRKSELHILKEVVLREPFGGLRQNYQRVQLASYFVELIELVTEPDHAVPDLFGLVKRAFGYLNSGQPTKRALLHFESELVRFLGIHGAPNVTPAVAIGRAYGRLPSGRAELVRQLS
jgi:DNA repair protein RecO (recombination protein O)